MILLSLVFLLVENQLKKLPEASGQSSKGYDVRNDMVSQCASSTVHLSRRHHHTHNLSLSLHFPSTALGFLRTMRNITLITLLGTLFATVLGDSLYQHANQEPLLSPLDSTKVPGKSPVEICSLSPSDDLVNITYINLTPNPPLAGQNLTIEAMGYLKTDVEEGAYANFEVKYGFIKLLSGTADLCEKAAEVDLECPVKKGQVKIQKVVELPAQIPPVVS